jgi:hypothetical protein
LRKKWDNKSNWAGYDMSSIIQLDLDIGTVSCGKSIVEYIPIFGI